VRIAVHATAIATSLLCSLAVHAQAPLVPPPATIGQGPTMLLEAPTPQPILTITSSATTAVANDRMHAVLRAEAENAEAAQAANDVNARMARARSRAKGVAGVDARTAGYSSYQISEQNRPLRWRVTQSLVLEGADFVALSSLVSKLQGTDGLLLSGLEFTVSPGARREAEDALTEQAIRSWQQRAQQAARAFGASTYRAGRVTIQASDFGPPRPLYKAGVAVAASVAPVSVEGGTTDVTVTVSGEAILDTLRGLR
jgi:predicted secreted protein